MQLSRTSPTTELTIDPCLTRIREILTNARNQALRTVNAAMVAAYWEIGREIVEEDQRGAARADYGSQLLNRLSAALTKQHGKGFDARNLRRYRQFYQTYSRRPPSLRYSSPGPQPTAGQIRASPGPEFEHLTHKDSLEPLSVELSWTHYRTLIGVPHPEARSF